MKPLAGEKRSNIIEQIGGGGGVRIVQLDFVSIMTFLGDLLTACKSFFSPPGSALGRCLLLYE